MHSFMGISLRRFICLNLPASSKLLVLIMSVDSADLSTAQTSPPGRGSFRLNTYFQRLGFSDSKADPSLFILRGPNYLVYLLVYVDDIILTGTPGAPFHSIITALQREFATKDLGPLHFFLGMEARTDGTGLYLTQFKYIHDILAPTFMLECKPISFSISSGSRLSLHDGCLCTSRATHSHLKHLLRSQDDPCLRGEAILSPLNRLVSSRGVLEPFGSSLAPCFQQASSHFIDSFSSLRVRAPPYVARVAWAYREHSCVSRVWARFEAVQVGVHESSLGHSRAWRPFSRSFRGRLDPRRLKGSVDIGY
ncbi:hypothetical protein CRG98_010361 [Punica granatum]|uniref:Reverse transcriptase Ty1/copia-type domain-containing protein n=1 Tax=Punica granatum TaxID=22663 RepID=A0A2I0KL66_PUNGR|nr:hypothetical protein CRG98_010361 [Punica granatum]